MDKIAFVNTIFGKKVNVVKFDEKNKLESIVNCPHCNKEVVFDEQIRILKGISCCDDCFESLEKELKEDYDSNIYLIKVKDYEPFGVGLEELKSYTVYSVL